MRQTRVIETNRVMMSSPPPVEIASTTKHSNRELLPSNTMTTVTALRNEAPTS